MDSLMFLGAFVIALILFCTVGALYMIKIGRQDLDQFGG